MAKHIKELIDQVPIEVQERAKRKADIILDEINFIAKLRKHRKLTQMELAEVLGTTQANVSFTENRDGVTIETVRRYVEGMGGKLEINVKFADETVRYGY